MSKEYDSRIGFGNRLRRLRQDAELSGKELAGQLSWPASKVSRLENGKQTASAEDVRAWTAALNTPDQVHDELIEDLRSLRVEYATWRRQLKSGFAPRQRASAALEHTTTLIRAFETALVPGLLQTADYARHVYQNLAVFQNRPTDIDEAVRTRLRRQDVLYQPERRFRFLITEAALRTRLSPTAVLRAQLDRLAMLSGLDTTDLAVIPSTARLPKAPNHGFWIFDDTLVLVETIGAELAIRDREDIALYERLFEAFWAVALHEKQAFDFIAKLALELGD